MHFQCFQAILRMSRLCLNGFFVGTVLEPIFAILAHSVDYSIGPKQRGGDDENPKKRKSGIKKKIWSRC